MVAYGPACGLLGSSRYRQTEKTKKRNAGIWELILARELGHIQIGFTGAVLCFETTFSIVFALKVDFLFSLCLV